MAWCSRPLPFILLLVGKNSGGMGLATYVRLRRHAYVCVLRLLYEVMYHGVWKVDRLIG